MSLSITTKLKWPLDLHSQLRWVVVVRWMVVRMVVVVDSVASMPVVCRWDRWVSKRICPIPISFRSPSHLVHLDTSMPVPHPNDSCTQQSHNCVLVISLLRIVATWFLYSPMVHIDRISPSIVVRWFLDSNCPSKCWWCLDRRCPWNRMKRVVLAHVHYAVSLGDRTMALVRDLLQLICIWSVRHVPPEF